MPPRRWYSGFHFLWTISLVLGGGCASMPFGGRMAVSEREPVIPEETKTASRSKPRTESKDDPKDVKPKTPVRERPPAIADRSAVPKKPIDPATQMLIDSELKDLPADERKRWKSYLASVEPSKIPLVLQKRAEGEIPPEVSQSPDDNDSKDDWTAQKLSRKKPSPLPIAGTDDRQKAPPSGLQQTAGEEVAAGNADSTPAIEIALEEETEQGAPPLAKDELERTALAEANAPAAEKHGLDAIKIWPQGKRGERSLTDRLSGGRISPLTPPWSRDSGAATEEKAAKAKAKLTPAPEKTVTTSPFQDTLRTDPQADYWQDELRKLISLMEAEASRPPADDRPAERQAHIQRQVYLRMLYLMAAEPEKAQLPIADVDVVDQEFWTSMFWGMSNYFDVEQTGDPGTRAAQTIAQLNAAARQLQSVADLELRNVSFSQQIDGWGLYDRFERDEFEPGQEVLLYSEIRNFSSEATAAGLYRTLISSTLEIVRAGQEDTVVEQVDLGQTDDQCRGRRTDFFHSYRMTIPAQLTSGAYQLRLSVEDKHTGRFATQTIGFTVR